jgi:hypothetical protein
MTTLIGKILVFVMVFASLVSVGVAIWLAMEEANDIPLDLERFRTNKNESVKLQVLQLRAINEEYSRRAAKARLEALALARILNEKEKGTREMPWDIEAQLFGGKLKSVAETKREVGEPGKFEGELDKEIKKLSDEKNTKVDTRNALLDDIKKQRDETERALAEQKRLRELISPDPAAQPGAKSFRDRLEDYRLAKIAAEEQQERVRPELFNESVRVSNLIKRQDELKKRLDELKKGRTTAEATSN